MGGVCHKNVIFRALHSGKQQRPLSAARNSVGETFLGGGKWRRRAQAKDFRRYFGGGDENVKNCSPPEKSLIIVGTSKEKDRASSARKNCQIFVKLLSNERTRCAGWTVTDLPRGRRRKRPEAEVCPVPEPWHDLVAKRTQEALPIPGLRVLQMQPYRWKAAGHGRSGSLLWILRLLFCWTFVIANFLNLLLIWLL